MVGMEVEELLKAIILNDKLHYIFWHREMFSG